MRRVNTFVPLRALIRPLLVRAVVALLGASLLVLGATSCSPGCSGTPDFGAVAAWLDAQALPQESVAVPAGVERCFADRDAVALPVTVDAYDVLAALDTARPDYVLATGGVAWDGVIAQPWFVDRYRPLTAWPAPGLPGGTATLFAYTPSPFDAGATTEMTGQFLSEAVVLRAFRVAGPRVTPGEPVDLTLFWDDVPGRDAAPLRVTVRLVEAATGKTWAQSEARLAPSGIAPLADARLTARYVLAPPDDLPQGTYRITVELAEPSGRLVPYQAQGGQTQDALSLTEVVHPPDASATPIPMDHTVRYVFSGPGGGGAPDEIQLLGYDMPQRVAVGSSFRVVLLWSADRPVVESYRVFVHVLDGAGGLVTQDDSVPVYGFYPTDGWAPGEYVRDEHILALPADMARGDYEVAVGLYLLESGDRLVPHDSSGNPLADSRVVLQTLAVR